MDCHFDVLGFLKDIRIKILLETELVDLKFVLWVKDLFSDKKKRILLAVECHCCNAFASDAHQVVVSNQLPRAIRAFRHQNLIFTVFVYRRRYASLSNKSSQCKEENVFENPRISILRCLTFICFCRMHINNHEILGIYLPF